MQKLGIVVDNLDQDYLGRVKVRVLGVHTQKDDKGNYIIGDDDLPWFRNGNMANNGNFSLPKLGDVVSVTTEDNYTGIYGETIYMNTELQEYFKNNSSDYQNASVLLYDNVLGSEVDDKGKTSNYRDGEYIKVYFMDSTGFCIDYKTPRGESHVVIDSDNKVNISSGENKITIDLSSSKIEIKADSEVVLDASKIKLGENATDGIIKSEAFINAFNTHTHPYLLGSTSKPTVELSKAIVSDKVKVE